MSVSCCLQNTSRDSDEEGINSGKFRLIDKHLDRQMDRVLDRYSHILLNRYMDGFLDIYGWLLFGQICGCIIRYNTY